MLYPERDLSIEVKHQLLQIPFKGLYQNEKTIAESVDQSRFNEAKYKVISENSNKINYPEEISDYSHKSDD